MSYETIVDKSQPSRLGVDVTSSDWVLWLCVCINNQQKSLKRHRNLTPRC